MSLMQLCWDLIWSPRSKGIPYVVGNGTFNQGLKLMLSLFGIMLGISFVENIAVFLLTPVSLAYVIGVLFGYILMWAFFKGFWLVLAYVYVKNVSNRELTFKQTFTAVSYAVAFDFPLAILGLVNSLLVIALNLMHFGYVAYLLEYFIGITLLVIALYYILCSLGLYRKMLGTSSAHIIFIGIVYIAILLVTAIALRA